MNWFYGIQQWLSITQYEFRVLLVLCILLGSGLIIREYSRRPEPLPQGIYKNDLLLLKQGAASMRAAAGRPRDKGVDTSDGIHSPPESTQINVNTATPAQLDRLPEVGPATAAAIIEYRKRRGRFETVDDLLRVTGIGPKTLEKMRPHVRVDGE